MCDYIVEKEKRNTLHRMEMGISHYYTFFKIVSVFTITSYMYRLGIVKILIVTLLRTEKYLKVIS